MGSVSQRGLLSAQSGGMRTLTPQEQLAKYQERTSDLSWVDRLLASEKDQNARFWLETIRDHGLIGLSRYVAAMERLKSQMPSEGLPPAPATGNGGPPTSAGPSTAAASPAGKG